MDLDITFYIPVNRNEAPILHIISRQDIWLLRDLNIAMLYKVRNEYYYK